jgi:hypothetical protein
MNRQAQAVAQRGQQQYAAAQRAARRAS